MGLGTFIQFTAGTKAVADDVNHNFDAITTWANHNVTSDNLGTLTNTLQFNVSSNVNVISIANSGNVASLLITQSDNLANGESIITIKDDDIDQTAVDAAEFRIKAKTASTIPAIWVTHDAVDTFKLTRTALNVSSAVTTTLGGPLVLSNPSVTGSINLAGNLSVTGKETINRTSTNQFLELANTTTSKSLTVTPETSSFDLNINDTASAYQFKINGITKARIDNDGLDGSYLKTGSVSVSALAAGSITAVNRAPNTESKSTITLSYDTNANTSYLLGAISISVSAPNKTLFISFTGIDEQSYITTATTSNNSQIFCNIDGPSGWTSKYVMGVALKDGGKSSASNQSLSMSALKTVPYSGSYTINIYYRTPVFPGGIININKYEFKAFELG